MEKNNLSKQEELCQALNVDFNEASELFSGETLQSMQMAKVYGGADVAVPWIPIINWLIKIISAGAGVATVVQACDDKGNVDKNYTGPTLDQNIVNTAAIKALKENADSVIVTVSPDGSVSYKGYYPPPTGGTTPMK